MTASSHRGRTRPGLALIEVVIATALVGVLIIMFTLAAGDSRRNASLSGSIGNLKQFAWAGSTYAADCNDRFWSFSWTTSEFPPGEGPFQDDLTAAATQAVDIIQRRTNIPMTSVPLWIPHILYSHLALADQLNLPLPLAWSVSPGDVLRQRWQQCAGDADPMASFLALPVTQRPADGTPNDLMRWMVSSSYQVGPAFISRDQRVDNLTTLQSALTNHYTYSTGTTPLGDRRMTQVAFPSRKVQLFDQYQWYFGKRLAYFAYEEARVPVLMADGSAMVRGTSESNDGFYPNIPTQAPPLRFSYIPRAWEPAALAGSQSLLTGHYQWTRGGLTGNDFGAPEVCTGQPGCTP